MLRWFTASAVAVGALGASVILAAPASAGCETQPFAQYCDGPVRPDGTWDRCFTTQPQLINGQYGQVTGLVPSVGRCYPVDPNNFPPTPIGQPQYHIYP
ncbi:hypothetical protein SEA_SEJANUS_41 [Mycobacterium phage Sejanus]|nr:hypothetical protein SEA_SEJANUS_41 [Mycobacterium phage Sejanus]